MTEQFCLIGRVADGGAIHVRSVSMDEVSKKNHHTFWPGETRKLFRFYPLLWRLDQSVLSTESLTPEDETRILEFMGRIAHRPRWTHPKAS